MLVGHVSAVIWAEAAVLAIAPALLDRGVRRQGFARRSERRLLLQVTRHGRVLDAGLSGHAVAETVKRACRRAGLDAENTAGTACALGW